jgi:hypothetical protein
MAVSEGCAPIGEELANVAERLVYAVVKQV